MYTGNINPNVIYNLPVTQSNQKGKPAIYATPVIPLHLQGKPIKVTVYVTVPANMPCNLQITINQPVQQVAPIQMAPVQKAQHAFQVAKDQRESINALQPKQLMDNNTEDSLPVNPLQLKLQAQKQRLKHVESLTAKRDSKPSKLSDSIEHAEAKKICPSLMQEIQNYQAATLKKVIPEPKLSHEQIMASKYFNLAMLDKIKS